MQMKDKEHWKKNTISGGGNKEKGLDAIVVSAGLGVELVTEF